jgi:hypothetical protein
MVKLLIGFKEEDLVKMDEIVERMGLPSRASAVRMALRGWGGAAVTRGDGDEDFVGEAERVMEPLEVPGVRKGIEVAEGAGSMGPAGYMLLEEVVRQTGAKRSAVLEYAKKNRLTKVGEDDRVYVRGEVLAAVEEHRGNPHWA